ncbi:hypothetical protein CEQ90_08425 [Lewinellaceae bacterium SD302]|nr:hypothetical protein CEQ90_08425 [Lewinellaceae bacterium SD302]
MHLHLWTVAPCVPLGLALFLMKKGTKIHRKLGMLYFVLMFFTATVALFLPALVGPTFLGHFGWIHSFCLLTIFVVPRSLYFARTHQVKRHKIGMILLYVGALLIAGAFTLTPGRYLHGVFFS